MNERLYAMMQMAAVRDGMVVSILAVAAIGLLSVLLLNSAPLPLTVRSILIDLQLALFLLAWIALLIILKFA